MNFLFIILEFLLNLSFISTKTDYPVIQQPYPSYSSNYLKFLQDAMLDKNSYRSGRFDEPSSYFSNIKNNLINDNGELDSSQYMYRGKVPKINAILSTDWLKIGKIGKQILGDCASIAIDKDGYVYVLHRGNRTWNINSFDSNFVFKDKESPIREHVLLKLDPKNGNIIEKNLANSFYMPHSITIDSDDNVWIVDVAMHQVHKYAKGRYNKAVLILGTKFEPGEDYDHFCQPTDVVVSAISGHFFISDGYCNHRILKYDANGNLISVFGKRDWGLLQSQTQNFLLVPHSLTLIERLDLICVADRENFRMLCLRSGTLRSFDDQDVFKDYNNPHLKNLLPRFEFKIMDITYKPYKPYAISYCPKNDKIYVIAQSISGPFVLFGGKISIPENSIQVDSWQQFPVLSRPHDLAIGETDERDIKFIYVADVSQQIWKFNETNNIFNYNIIPQ